VRRVVIAAVLVGVVTPSVAVAQPEESLDPIELREAIGKLGDVALPIEDPHTLLPSVPDAQRVSDLGMLLEHDVPAIHPFNPLVIRGPNRRNDPTIQLDHGTPASQRLSRRIIGGPIGGDNPTVFVDRGDLASEGIPPELLAPVVRILAGDSPDSQLLCTATLVTWDGDVGALTAAHCLYEEGGTPEQIGRTLRSRVYVEGFGAIEPSSLARVPAEFAGCSGLFYEQCANLGAADVAFVPLRASATWNVCTAPIAELDVVGFGYGLDRDRLPADLLKAALTVAPSIGGLWPGRSQRLQQVNKGDSGGPVVAQSAHDLIGFRAPEVCFVVAARRADESLLQPVWAYTSSMTPR
jgi:hypothetical protein